MTNCSNCYNGCTEIISDRCVKYTGIDVPVLGIQTGDSLSFVEQALITFLTSTLDGTGIKIDLGTTVVCNLVQQYLPTCGDLTIVDISKALIQVACDLQAQVDAIDATLVTLNADYATGCLTGVTSSSDTHAIVQAVINELCQIQVDLAALALDLSTNYVRYDELDALIQNYLNTQPGTSNYSNRMVPYGIIPYFGSLSNFDSTGAGTGNWSDIYLCNGNNGTPDLRGRVIVGAINGVPGPTLGNAVNPSVSPANPNYSLGDTMYGANQVTLTEQQLASHTHPNLISSTLTDPGHTHTGTAAGPYNGVDIGGGFDGGTNEFKNRPLTINSATTGITINTTIENKPAGGNLPHNNIQPVIATYYIIYIP